MVWRLADAIVEAINTRHERGKGMRQTGKVLQCQAIVWIYRHRGRIGAQAHALLCQKPADTVGQSILGFRFHRQLSAKLQALAINEDARGDDYTRDPKVLHLGFRRFGGVEASANGGGNSDDCEFGRAVAKLALNSF